MTFNEVIAKVKSTVSKHMYCQIKTTTTEVASVRIQTFRERRRLGAPCGVRLAVDQTASQQEPMDMGYHPARKSPTTVHHTTSWTITLSQSYTNIICFRSQFSSDILNIAQERLN